MSRHYFCLAVIVWGLSCLWHAFAQNVVVSITNPIVGNVGQSVEIQCSAFILSADGKEFSSPKSIILRRNGVLFRDSRLMQNEMGPFKIYTLVDLQRDDNGSRLQCTLSEHASQESVILVQYPPTMIVLSGDLITNENRTVNMVAGDNTTIIVTADSFPAPMNTLLPVTGSTTHIPTSFSVSGNMINIRNVSWSDGGEYIIVSATDLGSVQVKFTVHVEYPPIFTDEFSSGISCDSNVDPILCTAREGESGSLICNFHSNPPGTLSATFNSMEIQVTNFKITRERLAGNYTCTATNVIGGIERVTTRKMVLVIGDVPSPVEDGVATVDEVFIYINWTHNGNGVIIPVSSFTVVGGLVGSTSPPIINQTVSANEFAVMLRREGLDPGDYSVTLRAVNLLGGSPPRDVPFRIPGAPALMNTSGPNSRAHNVKVLFWSILIATLTTIIILQ